MAEVTNDLIYSVLKALRSELGEVKVDVRDIKGELKAVRSHIVGMQHDIANIYAKLGDHDERLERIETRLGLLEPAH